jgi:hypothetical protein
LLRGIFALCAGLFAAMIVYSIVAAIAQWAWPPPAGLDLRDRAQVAAFVLALPTGARLLLLSGPTLAAFAGGGVAAALASASQRAAMAAFIGALVAALTVSDWSRVGHPSWMLAAGVLLPLAATLAATLLLRKVLPAPGK